LKTPHSANLGRLHSNIPLYLSTSGIASFLISTNAYAGDGNLGPLVALFGSIAVLVVGLISIVFARLAPAGQRIVWAAGVLITLITITTKLSSLVFRSPNSRIFVWICCLLILSSGIALLVHVRKHAKLQMSSSNSSRTSSGVAIARLVAWIFAVGCITQLPFYFDLLLEHKSIDSGMGNMNFAMTLLFFIVSGFCAHGLWKLKPWSWWLTLGLSAVTFVRLLSFQFTAMGSSSSPISISTLSLVLLSSAFVLVLPALLLLPSVRKAFEPEIPDDWPATEVIS
jgi:hypothetical protein